MSVVPTQQELDANNAYSRTEKDGKVIYTKQALEYLKEKEGGERKKGTYTPERYVYNQQGELIEGQVYALKVVYQRGKRLQQEPVVISALSRSNGNVVQSVYELIYNKAGTRETRKLMERNVIQPSGQSTQVEYRRNLTPTQKKNKAYDAYVSKAKAAGVDTSREFYNSLTEKERTAIIDRGTRIQRESTEPSVKDLRAQSYKERKTPTTVEEFARHLFEKQGIEVEDYSGRATILPMPNVGPTGQPRRDEPTGEAPKPAATPFPESRTIGETVQDLFDTKTGERIQEFKEAGVFLREREKQGDKQTRNIILAGAGYVGLTFTQGLATPFIHPVQTAKGIIKTYEERGTFPRVILLGPLAYTTPTAKELRTTVENLLYEPVGTISRTAGGVAASVLIFKGATRVVKGVKQDFINFAKAEYEASLPYKYTPPKGAQVIDLARTSKPGTVRQFGVNVVTDPKVPTYAPVESATPNYAVTITAQTAKPSLFAVAAFSGFSTAYPQIVSVLGVKNFQKRRASKATIRKRNLNRQVDPRVFVDRQKGQAGIKLRGKELKAAGVKERVVRKDPFGNVEITDKGRSVRGGSESLTTKYTGGGENSFIQQQPKTGKKPPVPQGGNIARRQRAAKQVDLFLSGQDSQIKGILLVKQQQKAFSLVKREPLPEKSSVTTSRNIETLQRTKKSKKSKKKQEEKFTQQSVTSRPGFRPGIFARIQQKTEVGLSKFEAVGAVFSGKKPQRGFVIVEDYNQPATVNLPALAQQKEVTNPALASGDLARKSVFTFFGYGKQRLEGSKAALGFETAQALEFQQSKKAYGYPIPTVKVDSGTGLVLDLEAVQGSALDLGLGLAQTQVQEATQAQALEQVQQVVQDQALFQQVRLSSVSIVSTGQVPREPNTGPPRPSQPAPPEPPPQIFTPSQPPRTPPREPPRPVVPEVPPFLAPPPQGRDEERQRSIFQTLVRRRGKFRRIGVFGSALAAVRAGKTAVDLTPAASFKILGNQAQVAGAAQKLLNPGKYRRSKRESDVFVEKRSERINSPGEFLGITQKGLAAIKFGKKKLFGG